VEFIDNKNNVIGPQLVTFSIDSKPIAQLLPYPSPYNPNSDKSMKIKYVLNEAASVTINIYDRSGKFISKVLDEFSGLAGTNYAEWDVRSYTGDSIANGIYICEIIANNGKENRRYRSFAILRK
jgi:flagellar hook assembly protein FlgD